MPYLAYSHPPVHVTFRNRSKRIEGGPVTAFVR
jgi:hypothetical protein